VANTTIYFDGDDMRLFLDDAGRIELPTSVQTQLGIKPGDELVLEVLDGQLVISPLHLAGGLTWKGDVLVHEGTSEGSEAQTIEGLRREHLLQQANEGFAALRADSDAWREEQEERSYWL